jgi:phosphohistidine phosphatase
MRLYLIRHAIAEDRDAALWPEDGKRPLTQRGVRRFRRAAKGLATLVPQVDVLLSSPYVRAWDTAIMLRDEAGWPQPVSCDELASDKPPAVISALEPYADRESVALVGHEPYLGHLIAALLGSMADAAFTMRKGGAMCFDIEQLSLTEPAKMVWSLPPRVLRSLS